MKRDFDKSMTLIPTRTYIKVAIGLKTLSETQEAVFCDHLISYKRHYNFKDVKIIGKRVIISTNTASKIEVEKMLMEIKKSTLAFPEHILF